ncbi:MAG: site-2 protease family protein [Actinobacteria bacterium]|nr:site-2 protease family protein [Actinomycetota bacterium]MBM3713349.1 site-2 protease family protein [Actinomycetota bacterium]
MLSNIGSAALDFLKQLLIVIPGLYLGVVLHEVAHGYIAYRSGDPTAKNLGRLTLNPIAHIDIFGSIVLPLLLILLRSGLIFGYAKPVPINPGYFRSFRKGIRYSSLAGPATNLITAFVLGCLYGLFIYILKISNLSLIENTGTGAGYQALLIFNDIFRTAIYINIFLAIFNLIPIPPLDGANILASFLPGDAMYRFLSIGRFGFIFIFILLFLGGRIFWSITGPVVSFLFNIFTWWRYLI